MGHKAIETTRNINNAFGSRTANKHAVQWFFKKFCKGDKSLEDKEHSGQALKVDNGQLRAVIEADHLMTTETAEDSMSTILWSFGISSKLERWKSLIRGYLMSWLKIFLNCHFKVSSLILWNNSEPFLNWIVMCDEKWMLPNWWRPAQLLDREAPKHFPKSNFHQKKVVTIWWSAAHLIPW